MIGKSEVNIILDYDYERLRELLNKDDKGITLEETKRIVNHISSCIVKITQEVTVDVRSNEQ